jgi:hypothetical protein
MKIEKLAITSPDVSNGIVPQIVSGAQNAISTTAACGVTNYNTTLTTVGAGIAPTLADGALTGQLRRFQMIADGGFDAVLTPATAFQGGNTIITFADVGDTAEIMWNGSAWQILALYNVADGATAPVAS